MPITPESTDATAQLPPELSQAQGPALEAPEQAPTNHIEQLLSQLTPEELEQLAAQLSGDIQNPEAHEGGEDVSSLAHAIESHIAEHPETSAEGLPPEKAAGLSIIKSAAYIEGFLTQAMNAGAGVKQAVDMYDAGLMQTIGKLKTAKLVGNQHKLDVDKDGKIEASDLAELRHEKSESPAEEKREHRDKMKEAAYLEGFYSRAAEYGLDKQAMAKPKVLVNRAKNVWRATKNKAKGAWDFAKNNPYATGVTAAGGVAAGYALGNSGRSDEEKNAAYIEGFSKRASEYGLSENEILALLQQL
jgi:hypothetical protein